MKATAEKKVYDAQALIRQLMKTEPRAKGKDGKIILSRSNPRHVKLYEDED
ncbi:hypothetical protein [Aneurinibacillus aneurinilyticus]|uniref:hypothetical protein n=1 Tax=Aneurinibacillus aneurinilyticus TaxID=1391 RepID=UPI0023F559BE|nr:hypothetical protein [Aneurinibacillus aneurinilyticus]